MSNFNPKAAYDVLDQYYTEYRTQPKNRSRIEDKVRSYVNTLPDEVYIEACDGRASGLCEHGFFESDIVKVFKALESRIKLL